LAMLGTGEPFDVGKPACGDDDDVRMLTQNVGLLGEAVEAEIDAEAGELGDPPIDDGGEIFAASNAHPRPHLAAETRPGLEQHDGMAALRGDARRLHARRPASYHDDTATRRRRALDLLRQDELASARRVVHAIDFFVHAIGGADAGPDPLLLAA